MLKGKLKFRAIKNSPKKFSGILNCSIEELEILISSIEELEIHLGILEKFLIALNFSFPSNIYNISKHKKLTKITF
jgi:hypothetical protein